jgi:non-ribosomal peptide synthetase component F
MDVARMLTWTADRYPHHLGVGGPAPMTYREWDARTNRLARALAGLRVRTRDRVTFLLAAAKPWPACTWPCRKGARSRCPCLVSYWSPARTDVMRCVLKPSQCIRPT